PITMAPAATSTLDALERLQAPIIAAQAEYERVLAASHTSFLKAMEASYAALGMGTIGASPSVPHVGDFMPAPPPLGSPPASPPVPVSAPPAPPAPAAPTVPTAVPDVDPAELGAFLL